MSTTLETGEKILSQKPPLLPKPTHLIKKTLSEKQKKIQFTRTSRENVCSSTDLETNIDLNSTPAVITKEGVHDSSSINEDTSSSLNSDCEESTNISLDECDSNSFLSDLNNYSHNNHDPKQNPPLCSTDCSVKSFLDLSELGTDFQSQNLVITNVGSSVEQIRTSSSCDYLSFQNESVENPRIAPKCLSNENESPIESRDELQFFYQLNESEYNTSDSLVSLESSSAYSKTFLPLNTSNRDIVDGKKNKAFLIAKELLNSEKAFIDSLHLIVYDLKKFIDLHSGGNFESIIPIQVFQKLINPLPQLLELNELLLSDLEYRINDMKDMSKISDVIVKKGPFLKLYSCYVKNFEVQCNYLDECCQKYPRFSKILKEFENLDRCKKLTLKHYMLKPVQRIPQYKLLLQEYLENLDPDSSEHKNTLTALAIIHDVLNHANYTIQQGDHLSKLLQIHSFLGNYEILKPGREFIKDGELYKLSRKDMQLRYFVLLSDCLLYATYYSSVSGAKVKYELSLCGMKVNLQHNDPTEFSIITNTRSFTLRARTELERLDWVNCLQKAILEKNKSQLSFVNASITSKSLAAEPLKLGKEAPVWVQDRNTTMCQVCTAPFTITFRRHHCRSCGKVVCGSCSNNRAPLQYLKFNTARVCEECHNFLLSEYNDLSATMIERVQSTLNLTNEETDTMFEQLKYSFKKLDSIKRTMKYVPQCLKEVRANDSGSSMSGWLFQRGKRSWKRLWFVLKDQVLYVYKAPQDVVAQQSIPVLGYKIQKPSKVLYDDMDPNLTFMLLHPGQVPLAFAVSEPQAFEMWINALEAASTLH